MSFGRAITRQWITFENHVVQQRWWWGIDSVRQGRIWVSSYGQSRGWTHEFIEESTSQEFDNPLVTDRAAIKPGMFIGDGDPALRSSNTQRQYASGKACSLIGNESGFYLSDAQIEMPLIRWHQIVDVLPLDAKRIRKVLRQIGVEGIDLKSRNVRGIPEELTKRSSMKGETRVPVFVFSLRRSHVAVLCKPSN